MGRNKAQQRKTKKLQAAAEEKGVDMESGSNVLKDKGNKAFQAGDYTEALDLYSKAIAEDEKNHALYSNRSATYVALKRYPEALADAEQCVKLAPEWARGWQRKGDALEALLRYPEAYEAYRKGLELDAGDKNLKEAVEKMSQTLEELKMTASEMNSQPNPEVDKFELMVQWLQEGGSKFPKLYMRYYSEDYRGVHVLTKVAPGQIVLYVPDSRIMTSEVAKESDVGRKILAANVDLRSKHSFLAAYVLQEKVRKRDSPWFPYINILPVYYRNMPIFFPPELLKKLKGSFVLDKISERLDSLSKEYEAIKRGVPEFARHTLWDFIWARLVVITRIFGLVIKGRKTDGLVPYADMLNHKRPRETKWTYDDSMEGFTITTLKTVNRGEELFDSYGRKCNSRFFVNYGFALENNEDNEVVFKFGLKKDDPQYAMKVRFLGGNEASALREYQVPANYREKKTKEMFAFLRFLHARDQEIFLLPADSSKMEELEPLSVRNEIAVLKHIEQAARLVLANFPDPIEVDEQLLALPRDKIDPNERNIVLMRHGEKTVAHWYIKLAETVVPLLQQPWKDLKKAAAKCAQSADPIDNYIFSTVLALQKKQNAG
jgi:histone-lysine N-methyltransferase SETD3